MLIDNFTLWVAGHLDQLLVLSQYAWLAVGLVLLFRLRVFHPSSLAGGPARVSAFTVLTPAAAILLYCGTVFMVVACVAVVSNSHAPPASTMPATTTARPGATLPATAPATTEPASVAPTTQGDGRETAPVVYVDSTLNILREQAVNILSEGVPAVLLIILAARLVVGGVDAWGLSLRKIPKGMGYGILAFLAVMPLLLVVNAITEYVIFQFQHRAEEVHETLKMLSRKPPLREEVAFILLAGVAAPVVEEIFFRGCVQTMLIQPRFGFTFEPRRDVSYRPTVARRWLAIAITSLLFAGMHPIDHCAVIFLLAVSLGYVYERTGNMWANITLHALFNSFSIYFTLVSGS